MTTFSTLFVLLVLLCGVLSLSLPPATCEKGCASPAKLHDSSKLHTLEDEYDVFGPTTQADAKWLAEFVKDTSVAAALGKLSCCIFASCPLTSDEIKKIIDDTPARPAGIPRVVNVAERVHTAVEAKKDGSVCRHYAACMDKILSRMGYSPSYQCGYSSGKKVGHAWVEVKIDGRTLYVDAYNSIYYRDAVKPKERHLRILDARAPHKFLLQVAGETCECSDGCPHAEGEALPDTLQPEFMDALCPDSPPGSRNMCLTDEKNCCWEYCASQGLVGVCGVRDDTCRCSCRPAK